MKKTGVLNQPLSNVIAGMGHLNTLVIADAGLPIPSETQRIDLAVSAGIPAFVDVLKAVLSEMQVEGAIVAQEMIATSPHIYDTLVELLGDITLQTVSHDVFKTQTARASAVVRTGEFTPYANIILIAGVTF